MRGLTKPLGVVSYELVKLVKENIDKLIQLGDIDNRNKFYLIDKNKK